MTSGISGSCCIWSDLREMNRSVPGRWIWGDGSPLTHNPWKPGYPSEPLHMYAAMVKGRPMQMIDVHGHYWRGHFICEKY